MQFQDRPHKLPICVGYFYCLFNLTFLAFSPACPISVELAMIMDRLYGGVCYAGIDTDPELKYPKGAGRVAFSNQQSYIAAISARFVQLQHGDIDKRVSAYVYLFNGCTPFNIIHYYLDPCSCFAVILVHKMQKLIYTFKMTR